MASRNGEIASALVISQRTAESHVEHILANSPSPPDPRSPYGAHVNSQPTTPHPTSRKRATRARSIQPRPERDLTFRTALSDPPLDHQWPSARAIEIVI